MRRLAFLSLIIAMQSNAAWAEYRGVAGEYDDSAPIPLAAPTPTVSQPSNLLAPPAPSYAPAPTRAPVPYVVSGEVTSLQPDAGTPPVMVTGQKYKEKNFTFIAAGTSAGASASAPSYAPAPAPQSLGTLHYQQYVPAQQPAMESTIAPLPQGGAVANNYPVNIYDHQAGNVKAARNDYKKEHDSWQLSMPGLGHGETFRGKHSRATSGPRSVVINSNAEWMSAWQNEIGEQPPGQLGPNQKAVIVYSGPRIYSGYDADVAIGQETSDGITVIASQIVPGNSSAIAPDNIQPYAAIVLDAKGRAITVRDVKSSQPRG